MAKLYSLKVGNYYSCPGLYGGEVMIKIISRDGNLVEYVYVGDKDRKQYKAEIVMDGNFEAIKSWEYDGHIAYFKERERIFGPQDEIIEKMSHVLTGRELVILADMIDQGDELDLRDLLIDKAIELDESLKSEYSVTYEEDENNEN